LGDNCFDLSNFPQVFRAMNIESCILISIYYIVSLTSCFFILRIEERGVSSRYIIGLLINISIFLSATILHTPSILFILNGLYQYLLVILVICFSKIVLFNKLYKGKRIKYRIILISIPLCWICVGLALGKLHSTLEKLYVLFLLFFLIAFIIKFRGFREWLYVDQDEVDNYTEQKNDLWGRIIPKLQSSIGPSGEPLCDEIDDAIINDEKLNTNKHDKHELQFMLTCAKLRKDTISTHLSLMQNIYFLGVTLIIYPFLKILDLFSDYYSPMQSETSEIIEHAPFIQSIGSYFHQSIMHTISANEYLGKFIAVLMLVSIFLGLMVFFSLFEPNSRIQLWIKRHKKINIIYSFIWIVILFAFIIGPFLSMEFDKTDLSVFGCSTIIIVVSGYNLGFVMKQLKTTEKTILALDKAVNHL